MNSFGEIPSLEKQQFITLKEENFKMKSERNQMIKDILEFIPDFNNKMEQQLDIQEIIKSIEDKFEEKNKNLFESIVKCFTGSKYQAPKKFDEIPDSIRNILKKQKREKFENLGTLNVFLQKNKQNNYNFYSKQKQNPDSLNSYNSLYFDSFHMTKNDVMLALEKLDKSPQIEFIEIHCNPKFDDKECAQKFLKVISTHKSIKGVDLFMMINISPNLKLQFFMEFKNRTNLKYFLIEANGFNKDLLGNTFENSSIQINDFTSTVYQYFKQRSHYYKSIENFESIILFYSKMN